MCWTIITSHFRRTANKCSQNYSLAKFLAMDFDALMALQWGASCVIWLNIISAATVPSSQPSLLTLGVSLGASHSCAHQQCQWVTSLQWGWGWVPTSSPQHPWDLHTLRSKHQDWCTRLPTQSTYTGFQLQSTNSEILWWLVLKVFPPAKPQLPGFKYYKPVWLPPLPLTQGRWGMESQAVYPKHTASPTLTTWTWETNAPVQDTSPQKMFYLQGRTRLNSVNQAHGW